MDHLPDDRLQNIFFASWRSLQADAAGVYTVKSKDNIYKYGGKNETVF